MSADDDFVWEAPPEPTHGGPRTKRYDNAVREAKKNPGRWLRVTELAKTASPPNSARTAIQRRFGGDDAYECVVRRVVDEDGGPDKFGVWLRYRTPEQMGATTRKRGPGRPRKT